MKGTKPRLVIDNDAVSTVPRAPSWFSKDAAAEWRRIMPALVARRILTKADLGSQVRQNRPIFCSIGVTA